MLSHKRFIQGTAAAFFSLGLMFFVSGIDAADGESLAEQAEAMNRSVMVLYDDGQYAEAIPLALQALEIRERALGPEHPNVAVSLNNLALLYATLGSYAKAEPLYLRALAILEKSFGPAHPHVAAARRNLDQMYQQMEEGEEDPDSPGGPLTYSV